jgi:hypothetical protein
MLVFAEPLQAGADGLMIRVSRRACLVGEPILQASVAELVDRSDGAQNVAFAGILKKAHKANRGVLAPGKLSKSERCSPGLGVSEPAYEAQDESDHGSGHEPSPGSGHQPDHQPDHEPDHEPGREPGDEPGQETEGLVTLPRSAGGERACVVRRRPGEPEYKPGYEPAPEPNREPGYEPDPETGHKPDHERRAAKQLPPPYAANPLGASFPRLAISPTRSTNTSPAPSPAPRRAPRPAASPAPSPPSPTASPATSPVAMTRGAAGAYAGMRHHARSRVLCWFIRAAV